MLAFALASLLAATDVPVVSVLYFDNESRDADLEFMRKGFADLLITDLTSWDGVRVVERTRLEDVLKELKFQQTKYVDPAGAAKLGKVLNATYLIYGSMLLNGPTLLVQARLVRASDGAVLIALKESDDRDKVFDLEQRLATQLVAQIDAKLSPDAAARKKARVPNLATVTDYGRALTLADEGKLEEAQAALRAMVSKSPTFLLGREQLDAQMKAFEEYQKRRVDLVSDAIVNLGKRADEVLSRAPKLETLSEDDRAMFFVMRTFRGRLLARAMKQWLTRRDEHLRVAKPDSEAQAVVAMRAWVENQWLAVDEARRQTAKFKRWPTVVLKPADKRLIDEAQLGEARIEESPVQPLYEFVFRGTVSDGTRFTVGPMLSSIDPQLSKRVMDAMEAEVQLGLRHADAGAPVEAEFSRRLLEAMAEEALWRGDVDAAVTRYQRELDAFPIGFHVKRTEDKIRELLSGKARELAEFAKWEKLKVKCDDPSDAYGFVSRRLVQQGLRGLDSLAADVESICTPIDRGNEHDLGRLYRSLASAARVHEDCQRVDRFLSRYAQLGGTSSELSGWMKAGEACPPGDIFGDVTSLSGTLSTGEPLTFDRDVTSKPPNDRDWLHIDATRRRDTDQREDLTLWLKQVNGTYQCDRIEWTRGTERLDGTCTVQLPKPIALDGAGYDEGTFTADFPSVRISNGRFKAHREH